jgi:hypothetical protein
MLTLDHDSMAIGVKKGSRRILRGFDKRMFKYEET